MLVKRFGAAEALFGMANSIQAAERAIRPRLNMRMAADLSCL
jgi:hypothetical protein